MSHFETLKDIVFNLDNRLRRFYRQDFPVDIKDHVFLAKSEENERLAETLVIGDHEELFISIRVDPNVVQHIASKTLDIDQDLSSILILAEEISHFQCIIHAGQNSQQVSPFELELQAEFDKFILVNQLFYEAHGHYQTTRLARLVFDSSIVYDSDPIYDKAGDMAACWWWGKINELENDLFRNKHVLDQLKMIRRSSGNLKLDVVRQSRFAKPFKKSA